MESPELQVIRAWYPRGIYLKFFDFISTIQYEFIHRRPDSFWFKRNSGEFEAHLDGSKCTQEHRGIEVPEVSDAEDLSLNFPKAVAQ